MVNKIVSGGKRHPMSTIYTLGHPSKRTKFTYCGSVKEGVTLHFTGRPKISSQFFQSILNTFAGKSIPGGFNMTNPKVGGLGEWVETNSSLLNSVKLSPRHASFIAAILEYEGFITSSLDGNTVMLHFRGD